MNVPPLKMELTPVVELQICTNSDNCEIGANNICHYNIGQHLNLDISKKLYIAVKDVKVPSPKRDIDFSFYYGKDNKTISLPFPQNLMKQCNVKFNNFDDFALMLMKVANSTLKPLFDKQIPLCTIKDYLKVRYQNERFHINIPYGMYLILSANVCRLLGLYEEIYDACDKNENFIMLEFIAY